LFYIFTWVDHLLVLITNVHLWIYLQISCKL
jgi:hypothetical protein